MLLRFLNVALLLRIVEYDEASAYAEENGLLFMETSAKEHTLFLYSINIDL